MMDDADKDAFVMRCERTLRTAPADDMLVVATAGSEALVVHVAHPDPRRLVAVARSLLEQAADMADDAANERIARRFAYPPPTDDTNDDADLHELLLDVLQQLPDPDDDDPPPRSVEVTR